ncbi:hypothetical protein FRB98_006462 [Tulasnella sp. 332]|nr:hypothetical protein FRB98_006462 [Tulasnella sp. 332]
MFRACYPSANEAAEKEETAWVKGTFETAGSNGGGKLRLAGTWVPPNVALYLSESYGLSHILPALANAAPESRSTYRKNQSQNNTPSKAGMNNSASAASVVNGVTNGVSVTASALIPTSLPPIASASPTKVAKNDDSPARQPPAKKSRKSVSPSPSLLKVTTPSQSVRSSPRRPAKIQEEREEEEEPDVPAPDPDQDIQEAKEEVARLRAEHQAAQAHRETAAVEQAQTQTPSKTKKRGIEATATPPFKLDVAKIQAVADNATSMELIPSRPIINRRRLANLPPTQKAVAWGGLAFFLGLGASALIPTLLPGGGLW